MAKTKTKLPTSNKKKGAIAPPTNEKMTANILIRLTPGQKDVIEAGANKVNKSVSEFIRDAALGEAGAN